ncbi:MAG: 2,3-bisphosphoglycerate-independent phosphoglycerate mutase, partial [Patescibacteria group bacterium]|nr:2,3-bisphosphoglycerate-independent phosphoglycerate mutase [Patescibacteria group bacterium]
MLNKVLLIICDGLSDRPVKELGGKTPLEAANRPNLNALVKKGILGLMHTIDIGIRPGSDVAHLSIFGYDPYKYYFGRGPFEVAGLNMDFKVGDVAFRGNFATIDENLIITDRRAGRIENTKELVDDLNKIKVSGGKFILREGTGHRVGIILRGKNLSSALSDNDPHLVNQKVLDVYAFDMDKNKKHTARIINEFLNKAYQVLKNHPFNRKRINEGLLPANYLLLRGAGMITDLPSFTQKYGLSAACIAGAGLYKGVGRILGMKIIDVAGATGKPETNISAKIKAAIKTLKEYDFVFVHIKGADVLAEDGNFLGKKEFIEKIDKAVAPLLKLENILVVLTADHTTSSELKINKSDA